MLNEQEAAEQSYPQCHWKTKKGSECSNVTVVRVFKYGSVLKKCVAKIIHQQNNKRLDREGT